jgi:peptidoglycan/xylan/chitin deacetylase (PgdA/CDA1 family)
MLIRNFLFHRVSEEKDALWPPMKPEHFKTVIKHLTKNFEVVSLEKYLENPASFDGRKKLATVLFDDGYKDNIEFAAPILEENNCPASFYLVTDCINRNIPTWTYIIDHIFQQTRREKIELAFDFVPDKFKSVILYQNGNRTETSKEIKPWLKKLSNPKRLAIMKTIQEQCGDVSLASGKMMNWDDIRQLQGRGFTIGSHSHTHPMLASLENESEIRDELETARQIITKETGIAPLTISYPIGSFDERVTSMAEKSGYRYGLAVKQQFYNTTEDSRWEIPRVELYQESWWKTQLRIKGIYSRIKRVWA